MARMGGEERSGGESEGWAWMEDDIEMGVGLVAD